MLFGELGSPLVVVVHDWFGRLPSLEYFAQALSRQGFRVAVPDLYNGVATTSSVAARGLLERLEQKDALKRVAEAKVFGRDEGSVRVGVVGFASGGRLALLEAQSGSIDAVVAYYASVNANDHGVIPCPVQLHLADHDRWSAGESPDAFIQRLESHGTPVSHFSYDDTQHGFANATLHRQVNPTAASLAFARTALFLQQHLQASEQG